MLNQHKIHLNCSTDRASDGTIIRTSILVNIYAEDVETAVKLYRDIQQQLQGGEVNGHQEAKKEIGGFPECPDHKIKMFMRTQRTTGAIFFGCPLYESAGCQKTAQHPALRRPNFKMNS
jgi:hypothetical protein